MFEIPIHIHFNYYVGSSLIKKVTKNFKIRLIETEFLVSQITEMPIAFSSAL